MSVYVGPAYGEVETVEFSVAGDDDNLRDSVVEVKSGDLFADVVPISGGCFDARMGTTSHHYACSTCLQQRRNDPGHFGRIEARTPLPSPLFVPEIRRWLRVVCLTCGALLVNPEKFAKTPAHLRLGEAARTETSGVKCPVCGGIHPKIIKDDEDRFSFQAAWPGSPAVRLHMVQIKSAFERVTDETVRLLGRPPASHPKNLVLNTALIPSNTIRPGVRMGFSAQGAASFHALTNFIQRLVIANQNIPETLTVQMLAAPATSKVVEVMQLIYHEMILGSSITAPTQGQNGKRGITVGNAATSSIVRNFAQKSGRIRKNLLGKRVWNISRSTISGNPMLRLDEVGFPVAFARTIQIQETVQEYNIERLMKYFRNGRREYPGCSRVVKQSTGAVHRVEGLRRDFRLEVGDVLSRDVVDGDVVFFNRQPSLEKSSIGVHRVVVLTDPSIHTFQMNVAACDWYNADFDGDQMNLWPPRGVMSRAEAQLMSSVANNFISTKSGGPVNGQVQDSVVGSFELSRDHVVVDKFNAMSLFAEAKVAFPNFSGAETLGGRDVVSLLFERTPVNYNRKPSWFQGAFSPFIKYNPIETRTVFKNGRMLSGVLDKISVGAGSGGGVFHLIAREYGAQKALDMIFALQQVAIAFVEKRGFTVGTADMTVSDEAAREIRQIVGGLQTESAQISRRLVRGDLIPPIGMTTHEYYERLQIEALKAPDEILRPLIGSIKPDWNGLFKMIATRSKGSTPNLMHISALIGQVEINTQRITEQFGFRRTAVFFPRFALSPEAYGFNDASYIEGMSNFQFLWSAMNSRFDLINKALSTASTGYQNRKAIMALQSAIVDNYRRVAKGARVVQLLYGDDGLDARKVEPVRMRAAMMDDKTLASTFGVSGDVPAAVRRAADAATERIKRDRDEYRDIFARFEDTDFGTPMTDVVNLPVNVKRLVSGVLSSGRGAESAGEGAGDLKTLPAKIKRVDEFCGALPYVLVNEIQEKRRAPVPQYISTATTLLQMHVRTELAPPVLQKLSDDLLTYVFDAIRFHYAGALVDYGSAVGVLAAQAVSEPLTQYMLDSHHRSVGGGTNKSGIIRPEEIFMAKSVEKEKSSEMVLRVLPEIENDRAAVLQAANQIELMILKRVVSRWWVLYEPYGDAGGENAYPDFAQDSAWLEEFRKNSLLVAPPTDLTSWCLRLELNKSTMILKSVDLETVVEKVRSTYPNAFLVHAPENVARVVVRVYFREAQFRAQGEDKILAFLTGPLLKTKIRGVPRITRAEVVELKRHTLGPGGAISLKTVYGVRTVGTNMYGVLLNKWIDPLRIVSSSIGDTAKLYGIAAVRTTIVREIRRFFESKAPNVRHMKLYADEMTRTGKFTSLEPSGIGARERNNVLLRLAMSGPTQVLQDAALTNTRGPIYGISPYLVLGRTPRLGSLWNDVVIDQEYVRKNTKSIDDMLDELTV